MEFMISQGELTLALNKVKGICKGRSTLPILNNVLIEAEEDRVSFTTTDLTLRLTHTAKETVKVTEPGRYTVHCQKLVEIAKALPKGASITVRQNAGPVEVMCSGRKVVEGLDAEEYPLREPLRATGEVYELQREEYEPNGSGGSTRRTNTYRYEILDTGTQSLYVSGGRLVKMLNQVVYATEADGRPVLQGIHIELTNDRLALAAAGAYRFATHSITIAGAGSWKYPGLLDGKTFLQIARLLSKTADVMIEVAFTIERLVSKNGKESNETGTVLRMRQASIVSEDGTSAYLRPIEGSFPNYRSIIPKECQTRVVCETADFLSGCRAIWPVAKESSNLVTLRIAGNMVCIEARSEAQPEPTVHEMDALIAGPDITINLNCQYLLDVLKVTSAPEVAIELTGPKNPVLFLPRGEEEGETRHAMTAMHVNKEPVGEKAEGVVGEAVGV